MLKQPSAWIPIAMSLAALALVLTHVLMFGVVREADEGAGAHLFQLLMVGQLLLIGYFRLKWLPLAAARALAVLALQAGAAIAAWVPVYWFNL